MLKSLLSSQTGSAYRPLTQLIVRNVVISLSKVEAEPADDIYFPQKETAPGAVGQADRHAY
jgi:hypothetical protein